MSMVEAVVAISLTGAMIGSLAMVNQSASSAQQTASMVSELDSQAWRALDRICERLRDCDQDALDPQDVVAPFNTSRIDYQRVIGFENGARVLGPLERIQFEYSPTDPDDGLDNDGNGAIDEGRIVWISDPGGPDETRAVLASPIAEVLQGEIVGNLVDENGNGLRDERGFSIDYTGTQLNVRLTLERQGASGIRVTRTVQRTVMIRNQTQ